MARLHYREVSPINCRNRCDFETLSGDHDRGIDRAQGQVAVGVNQFGDPHPVASGHGLNPQVARSDIAQKAHFGIRPQAGPNQVADLGDHQHRHHQWAGVSQQEIKAGRVMTVVSIDVGVERPSVDYQCDGATSLARISSIRSDMSQRPL